MGVKGSELAYEIDDKSSDVFKLVKKNVKKKLRTKLNIYLSQLVRVRGKYTFLSFSDFQTLDPVSYTHLTLPTTPYV